MGVAHNHKNRPWTVFARSCSQSSGEGVGRSSRSAVPDAGVERSSRSTAFQRGSSKARHDGSSCGVMTQVGAMWQGSDRV